MNRRTGIVWLALFLGVAAFLRLYAVTEAGIYDLDEGLYLVDGHAKLNEWRLCADLAKGKLEEMRGGPEFLLSEQLPGLRDALAKETPFAGKHAYYYLIALIMLLTGPVVWSGIVIDAVAGIGSVWLVHGFVKRLWSERAGLIAAGITALCAYHVFYSRRVYGTTSIAFLFMAAVYCHLRAVQCREEGCTPRRERLLLTACGMFAGLCFIVNFQIAVLLPVLALIHFFTSMKRGNALLDLRWLLEGGLFVLLGFAIPIACMEAASYPMILLFRSQGLQYPHGTFLELVTPKLTSHLGHSFYWSGFVLFPFFLGVLDGYPVLILCAVLPLMALLVSRGHREQSSSSRARAIIYLACWFLVPFVIFSTKTPQSSRIFVNCLPPLFAALAILADIVWSYSGNRKLAVRAILVLVLAIAGISSTVHNVELLRMRSGYPELMRWLASTPEKGASAPYGLVLLSYLREYGLPGGSYTTYKTYGIEPPPYFVADRTELWDKRYPDESEFLPPGARPVQQFQHTFGRMLLEAGAFPPEGNPIENIRWVRNLDLERARQVLVYDIRTWDRRTP